MGIRLSGMASGLDTESMIKDLMSAYNTQKQKKVGTATKYSWKMEAWSSLNTKISNFYSKSVNALRFSSAYKTKKSVVSDATKASATASSTATIGTQTLAIKQLAQAGYLTGGVLSTTDDSKATTATTLADLGYTGGSSSITVTSGKDNTTSIEVDGSTTIKDFVSKLSKVGVNANFDATNQRIFVSAKSSGADNDFQLTSNDSNSTDALKALGLYTGVAAGTSEYKTYSAWASYDTTKNADGTYASATTQAVYDTELSKRVDTYKNSIVAAQEAIDKANETIEKSQKKLDGYTDDDGNKVEGLRSKLEANSQYASARAEAEEYIQKIADGTITNEEKRKLGISSKSAEELAEVSADTLTSTILSNQLTEITKQIGREDDSDARQELYKQKEELSKAADLAKNVATESESIAKANKTIAENQNTIDDASQYVNVDAEGIGEATDNLKSIVSGYVDDRVDTAKEMISGVAGDANRGAVRVYGQNAQIYLNGAFFESNTNGFDVNGIAISVTGETGLKDSAKGKAAEDLTADDYNVITMTTDTDVDGIYDTIKNFINGYNELIKEMDKLYNADSASKYDILSDDEKDAMSDTEVEAWNTKIKDALLRRDDNLNSVIETLKNAMGSSYEINGTKYSLASFGIETMSYFLSANNDKGVYHINGDADDADFSSYDNKLKAAITSDPEGVQDFFVKLTQNLYTQMSNLSKMSTSRSFGSFYDDKAMKKQYTKYNTDITDFETKVNNIEDKYYKQFSNMEVALSKLQSSTSSITALLGS